MRTWRDPWARGRAACAVLALTCAGVLTRTAARLFWAGALDIRRAQLGLRAAQSIRRAAMRLALRSLKRHGAGGRREP